MKNYQRWVLLTLLALCFSASALSRVLDDPPSAVSYCDLLSMPQKYDKQTILTQALIHSNDHEVLVYDLKCESTPLSNRSASIELPSGWNSTKPGKRLSKIFRHDGTACVRFEAVFHGSGGPFGQEVTQFRFVLKRIISVEKAGGPAKWIP